MYIKNNQYCQKTTDVANEIINSYLNRLEPNDGNPIDPITTIHIIAELWDYFEDREKWLETAFLCLKKINQEINEAYSGIGAFNGLTSLAQALCFLSEKTGEFGAVKKQVDKELVTRVRAILPYYEENIHSIFVRYYDTISGLAGALNYLVNIKNTENRNATIEDILEFYLKLCEIQKIKDSEVPNWFVKSENLTHSYSEFYPDGNLNFSMSHGMIGPLASVCKLYKSGYKSPKIKDVIRQIIPYYEKYGFLDSDLSIYWPGYLPLTSFKTTVQMEDLNTTPSWCYGNWSIAWVLLTASSIIEDTKLEEKMRQHLNIVCRKKCNYEKPVVCHGYAGNLIMLIKFQKMLGSLTKEIEKMTDNILKFYRPDSDELFTGLEDADGILGGCGGVILSLICLLKDESHMFDLLMLN